MDKAIETIYIDSCWRDEDEVKEFARTWKRKYGIKATFNDGSDWYSSWTLEGPREILLDFLDKEYLPYISKSDLDDDLLGFIEG